MPQIRALDGMVLAVSVDTSEQSRQLAARRNLDLVLISDPEGKAIDLFGVRHKGGGFKGDVARPAVFLLDREGKIAWRHLTDNWRVRVRPETVLEQLRRIP
jgi:peroxiredoxin